MVVDGPWSTRSSVLSDWRSVSLSGSIPDLWFRGAKTVTLSEPRCGLKVAGLSLLVQSRRERAGALAPSKRPEASRESYGLKLTAGVPRQY